MLLWAFWNVGSFRACTTRMLRGKEKVDPVKDSLALTLKVKRAKPETEPKNGNRKLSFRSHRCDGRSFRGRGCYTNLAGRKQQKAR